uniref:Uncharacterized protein n=5 Tax=Spongospora subterranea TaxID=70186 RepID=A0A0H5QXS2_9EUKA|eukprot:CRZ06745.1 hypothetical protein [Spongospora subterranea]
MDGLSTHHHRCHFTALLTMITTALSTSAPELAVVENVSRFRQLCGAVMDFSEAQRNVFVEAYVDVVRGIYLKNGVSSENEQLAEEASGLIKGCCVHFLSSAERIARNYAIVGRDDNGKFLKLVMEAVDEPMQEAFITTIQMLQMKYPKARCWFDWWLQESVARLIFACKRHLMNEQFASSSRNDSNPIESMHAVFYQIAESKNTMVFGLSALMLFVGTLEDDFQDRLIGIETHYGDSEKWERSIQRANRTLDQRQKPQLVPNDGRPPDTSKNLLNSRQKETSKPQSGPGRPRGSKNVDRNLGTTYQSYMHYNNTCYITSLLECLFTIMGYCEI